MATEYEAFFTTYRKNPSHHPTEACVLEPYLSGTLTPQEAAQQIAAPSSDRHQAASGRVGKVWDLLFLCAEDCPGSHLAIEELMRAILTLPTPTLKWEVDWTEQRESLGWLCRDTHDSLWSDIQSKSSARTGSTLGEKWKNFYAFIARNEGGDLWLGSNLACAMQLIVDALENKTASSSESTWFLQTNVPAAAQWFIYAGKLILKNAKKLDKQWFSGVQAWRGKEGFSEERWEFWEARLDRIGDMENLSEETKEWARRAGVAMGKAEKAKK